MQKLLAFIICITFVGVGDIYGQPLKRHALELKPEISYYTYKESDITPLFDVKHRGIMYGASLSYTYHRDLMLKGEARGNWGHIDYHNSGSMNNIRDYILELRGLGGWDFFLSKAVMMTPYLGIGYRYLNDDSSGKITSTGAFGYERESNYIYSPLGIELNIDLGNKWLIGETTEFDYFWWGKQKSHLSDVNPGFNDLSNHQKKGWGFRSSIGLRKQFSIIDFAVGPFIRYWNIKKSEKELITLFGVPWDIGWEPRNKSTEIGLLLAITF